MTEPRVLVAIMASPLAAPAITVTVALYSSGWSVPFSVLLLIAGPAALFSYLGFFLFGLPVYSLLRRRGSVSAWPLLISGVVGGVVTFWAFNMLLTFMLSSLNSFRFEPPMVAWGAGLGLSVSLAFCVIAGITSASSRRASLRSARG